MADFCKDCSEKILGFDTKDLADITTDADIAKGEYAWVLCEGCGYIPVDKDGKRVEQTNDN